MIGNYETVKETENFKVSRDISEKNRIYDNIKTFEAIHVKNSYQDNWMAACYMNGNIYIVETKEPPSYQLPGCLPPEFFETEELALKAAQEYDWSPYEYREIHQDSCSNLRFSCNVRVEHD